MKDLDFKKIDDLIKNGYISKRKHPIIDIWILNYTPKCSIKQFWTPETIACRGLIVDDKNRIIERPFKKFFTFDQYQKIRNSIWWLYNIIYSDVDKCNFTVSEKLDGALGILYHDGFDYAISTRGSFESPQAIKATKILRAKYSKVWRNPNLTYLFEIICDESKVVIDYGFEDLVLIDVVDKDTGYSINWRSILPCSSNLYNIFPTAKSYAFDNLKSILEIQEKNGEGFVIFFPELQFRIKVKFSEYLRLHKILSSLSEKNILKWLSEDIDYADILENLPKDKSKEIEFKILEYQKQYEYINKDVEILYNRTKGLPRKLIAERHKDNPLLPCIFSKIDNKDYSKYIWKIIKNNLIKNSIEQNT